ncbi:class I SAM-dependent methyltransferase [bacterium]|nr:class I SAM-dependent methyltransferase [bacterium]
MISLNMWKCRHLKAFWDEQAFRPGLSPVSRDETLLSTRLIISYLSNNFIFSGKRVLDLGCGVGRIIPAIFCNGAPEIYIGIDWSNRMITKARQYTRNYGNRVHFLLGDITNNLPFNEITFDFVIVWTIFTHILDEILFEKALIQASNLSSSMLLICDPTCSDSDIPFIDKIYPTKKRRKEDYLKILNKTYNVKTHDIFFGSCYHPESLRTVFYCLRK